GDKWKVDRVYNGKSGYIAVVYVNEPRKQVVIAHQGTCVHSLADIVEDISGVFGNKTDSGQRTDVFQFIHEVVTDSFSEGTEFEDYHLSFTGHSLGAFLASLSVFYSIYSLNLPNVNAVTFENPGAFKALTSLQPHLLQNQINLAELDIVNYLSYPNIVNTCHSQIGTVYAAIPTLGDLGWFNAYYTSQAHSMDNMLSFLKGETALSYYMLDWPVAKERDYFFKHAVFAAGEYKLPEALTATQNFEADYKAHYKAHQHFNDKNSLSLIHFSKEMTIFLKLFYEGLQNIIKKGSDKLTELMKLCQELKMPDDVKTYLVSYNVLKLGASNTEIIYVIDKDIQEFRKTLSRWLAQNSENVDKLISSVKEYQNENGLKIIAEIIGPNAEVGDNTVFRRAKAIGFAVLIPENAGPETQEIVDAVLKAIKRNVQTLESYIVAPGAKVGKGVVFEDVEAIASQLVVQKGLPPIVNTNEQFTKVSSGTATTITKQREQAGLAKAAIASTVTSTASTTEQERVAHSPK
ncbi:MAG: hypothetical protein ACK4PR_09250, partial [Gammaproteobacteria bacterium]